MFFRIVRAAGGKGVQHEYVRLVESYREHGKPKQRVVCNLGRKDLLVANLDSLNRLLGAGEPADTERAAEQVAGADAWDWGPMLVTATRTSPFSPTASVIRKVTSPVPQAVSRTLSPGRSAVISRSRLWAGLSCVRQ